MSRVNQQLIRLPEVRQRVGISSSEIYRRIRRGVFPAPISLGPRTAAWDSHAVDEWVSDQIKAAREAA